MTKLNKIKVNRHIEKIDEHRILLKAVKYQRRGRCQQERPLKWEQELPRPVRMKQMFKVNSGVAMLYTIRWCQ